MKRIQVIICSVIIVIALIAFFEYKFRLINFSNEPYLSNKKQFQNVFDANIEMFCKLVESGKYLNNLKFQYNSSLSDDQVYSLYGNGELSESILFLIKNAGMTNFQKTDNGRYFLIYQYAPEFYSDVYIGIRYDYQMDVWTYYYNHDYNNCKHKNKIIYRFYDLLFNFKTNISVKCDTQ